MIKEYTRVIKNNIVVYRVSGFRHIDKIIECLKQKKITGRYEIQHILLHDKIYVYANYFINNCIITGTILPYNTAC